MPLGLFDTVWAYLKLREITTVRAGQRLDFWGNLTFAARLTILLIIWLQGIWLPLHGFPFTETPLWAGIYTAPMLEGGAAPSGFDGAHLHAQICHLPLLCVPVAVASRARHQEWPSEAALPTEWSRSNGIMRRRGGPFRSGWRRQSSAVTPSSGSGGGHPSPLHVPCRRPPPESPSSRSTIRTRSNLAPREEDVRQEVCRATGFLRSAPRRTGPPAPLWPSAAEAVL
ncbi:MAG TPA: hypothetical protein VFE42_22040 [Chloroflexota bacterium]|nr:hypothetical protein [Chloroflexota bacterium]